MPFEHLGDEKAHRVATIVRRQVADADPVVAVARRGREPLGRARQLSRDPFRIQLSLQRGIVVQGQRRERSAVSRLGLDRQAGQARVADRPDRHALAHVQPVLERVGLVRVDQQRRAKLGRRGFELASRLERSPEVQVRETAIVVGRHDAPPGRQRRVVLAERLAHEAEIDQRFVKVGLERERVFVGDGGLFPVAEPRERDPEIEPDRRRRGRRSVDAEPGLVEARRFRLAGAGGEFDRALGRHRAEDFQRARRLVGRRRERAGSPERGFQPFESGGVGNGRRAQGEGHRARPGDGDPGGYGFRKMNER